MEDVLGDFCTSTGDRKVALILDQTCSNGRVGMASTTMLTCTAVGRANKAVHSSLPQHFECCRMAMLPSTVPWQTQFEHSGKTNSQSYTGT